MTEAERSSEGDVEGEGDGDGDGEGEGDGDGDGEGGGDGDGEGEGEGEQGEGEGDQETESEAEEEEESETSSSTEDKSSSSEETTSSEAGNSTPQATLPTTTRNPYSDDIRRRYRRHSARSWSWPPAIRALYIAGNPRSGEKEEGGMEIPVKEEGRVVQPRELTLPSLSVL
ncbi:hypothetical protein BDR22DRAFT_819387 [Usnea florida]